MSQAVLHLTFTGVYAGEPICGAQRHEGDQAVHMIYAPLDKPEFRATVCPNCLKAYIDSFEAEEIAAMPDDHWVKQEAMKYTDGQQPLSGV